jgi:hypothetical protein
LKGSSGKKVLALLLLAVFLASYFAAFFIISSSPSDFYSEQVYSTPEGSSSVVAAWENQYVGVGPAPNSTNVPRDTYIMIGGARPVKVENFTISPQVSIANETNIVYSKNTTPFSNFFAYPTGLLEPNTAYNVSATVAGISSWWVFTTSSEPTQVTYTQLKATSNLQNNAVWISLLPAVPLTLAVAFAVSRRRKNSWFDKA